MYSIYSNTDVVRYTSDLPWTEKQEAKDFISSVCGGLEESSLFGWCVEQKETRRVIATCALFDCALDKKVAEISYVSHLHHWRQGYIGEFLPFLIELGFMTLKLNRISAFVDSRNTASLKLLTTNGFKHEGVMRDGWVDSEGPRFWDNQLTEDLSYDIEM